MYHITLQTLHCDICLLSPVRILKMPQIWRHCLLIQVNGSVTVLYCYRDRSIALYYWWCEIKQSLKNDRLSDNCNMDP